jgi:hypothetical protein
MSDICREAEANSKFVFQSSLEDHIQMKAYRKPPVSKFAHSIADAGF